MYDRKRLLDDVDPQRVISYLGVPHQNKGKYTYVTCPSHIHILGKMDTHFGNCVLTRKGVYCYACQKSTNIIDAVASWCSVDIKGAMDILAESTGCPDNYLRRANRIPIKKTQTYLLTAEELQFLGLSPLSGAIIEPVKISEKRESYPFESRKQEEGYLIIKKKPLGIYDFFKNDQKGYRELIKRKALEAYYRYSMLFLSENWNPNEKKSIILLVNKAEGLFKKMVAEEQREFFDKNSVS